MVEGHAAKKGQYPHLAVIAEGRQAAEFYRLLQQGVLVRRRVGCSVEMFLRQELGVAAETIEHIQSVMLDGKPVDDIATAAVRDGEVLALSAAMPGLVGATLRRAGAYSSLRGAITYHETAAACEPAEGWVKVKVFNLLMAEMGPGLMQEGVSMDAAEIRDFLADHIRELREGCTATLDGRTLDLADAPANEVLARAERVFLTVLPKPGRS